MFSTVPTTWMLEHRDVIKTRPSASGKRALRCDSTVHDYYVTGKDGNEVLLLAGPFNDADEAKRWVPLVRGLLAEEGAVLAPDLVSTTRMLSNVRPGRTGDLNRDLGL